MQSLLRHILRSLLAVLSLAAAASAEAQQAVTLSAEGQQAAVSAEGAAPSVEAPESADSLAADSLAAGSLAAARPAEGAAAVPAAASVEAPESESVEGTAAVPAPSFQDRYRQRGITELSNVFVPRGQWVLGASLSYSTHVNRDYTFLVIEDINSEGYTFRISPMAAYALRDNMALGLRATYSRTNLTIDGADLRFGDEVTGTEIVVDHYKSVRHSYVVSAVWRQYIPLGRSKRFALFNEMSLGAGGSQAIFASGQPVTGTYERGYTLALGISPGLMAFATNDVAIEVNVGVMGVSYSRIRQVHNQVSVGHRSTSGMNFKVNIFTIEVGVAFYL